MKIINKGRDVAYIADDAGTFALAAGKTADVRMGVAEFAVRNVAGVEYAGATPDGFVKGLSEARVEAAVTPIAEHVTEHPADIGYVVDGQASGGQTEPYVGTVEVHEGVALPGPLPTEVVVTPAAPVGGEEVQLRGADLDAALESAGLPRTGTADEKRARYAEYLAAQQSA